MWDLPGPGLESMSPALAGGFLTTAPPGKSSLYFQKTSVRQVKQIFSFIDLINNYLKDSPDGAVVKNPPANTGDMGLIPGLESSHMPQSN